MQIPMAAFPSPLDPFGLPIHGGDLTAAEARFGVPADGWLDLSTGINPFAYPLPPLAPAAWQALPTRRREAELAEIAAAAYGAADPGQMVVAPGTQAIIQLLPRLVQPSEVTVVGPTYAEHASSWSGAGHRVTTCEGLDQAERGDVVVVVNPNNPDGTLHSPERLRVLAEAMAERGGLLIVDEAFADPTPDSSVVAAVGPSLLVLRSFGKFFGLGGLRLGFAVADPAMARLLRGAFGPWSVSGPALAIGCAALSDSRWIAAMRHKLVREASSMDALLSRARLPVIGGTTLFRLVGAPRAWALYEHLGQRGILVRPFASSPRWLRFGLPADDGQRQRLRAALEEFEG